MSLLLLTSGSSNGFLVLMNNRLCYPTFRKRERRIEKGTMVGVATSRRVKLITLGTFHTILQYGRIHIKKKGVSERFKLCDYLRFRGSSERSLKWDLNYDP